MTAALLLLLAAGVSAQSSLDAAVADGSAAARAAAARPAVVVDKGSTGSWYRKIASVESTGFDAVTARGVLPQPTFDPTRMHTPVAGEASWTDGPLDSPGVYLGAHAEGREIDAGLKWDHRFDESGKDTGWFAWRVFWRTASPAGNVWRNPVPGSAQDLYLDPGDRFSMTVTVSPDGTARLEVRGEGKGAPSMSVVFPIDGFWNGTERAPRSFKRVHSIDQFRAAPGEPRAGNENATVIPTAATLSGGRWDSVELTAGKRRAPLTGGLAVEFRGADEEAGYAAVFPTGAPDAKGGEEIRILPPHP